MAALRLLPAAATAQERGQVGAELGPSPDGCVLVVRDPFPLCFDYCEPPSGNCDGSADYDLLPDGTLLWSCRYACAGEACSAVAVQPPGSSRPWLSCASIRCKDDCKVISHQGGWACGC